MFEHLSDEDRRQMQETIGALGFVAFGPPALPAEVFRQLLEEAARQRHAAWNRSTDPRMQENVARSEIGEVARSILTAPATVRLVAQLIGEDVQPSFEATCFTYYTGPGQFLGFHRDRRDRCLATFIVYLQASWPAGCSPGAGFDLQVFGRNDEPLGEPAVRIRAAENRIAVGRGAEFPHGRAELQNGECLTALTACYAGAARSTTAVCFGEGRQAEFATHCVEQGYAAWNRERFGEARDSFEKALQVDPECDAAWNGLGNVLWSERSFEASRKAFAEATKRHGYNAGYWSNLGLCLRDLGHLNEALNTFSVALQLDPNCAFALNEWGNVLQDLGRYREALPYYYRALAVDPSRAVVHHNLGIAHIRLGQPELGFSAFRAALARDREYHHSLEEIGILFAHAGVRAEAERYFERAGTERAKRLRVELLGDGSDDGAAN